MKLLLAHGWGFDASVWQPLLARLKACEATVLDRGYFGDPHAPVPERDYVAVTHSMGAMRVLAGSTARCRGLVAINGFDRFVAAPGIPGVPLRVVERMVARFGEAPAAVLAEFRARCGASPPPAGLNAAPLLDDLRFLRDGDARAAAERFAAPILSLQGALDPILPAELRVQAFAPARAAERAEHPGAGHLLPIADPDYCARHIERFLDRLP